MAAHGIGSGTAEDEALIFVFLGLTLLTTIVTFGVTYPRHLRNLYFPELQINMLRIIAVCPVFSLLLWLTLAVPGIQVFVECMIASVEGYVLFCFFALMVLAVGGESAAVSHITQRGEPFTFKSCMCCDLIRFPDARSLYRFFKYGVQQLIWSKSLIILIVGVLEATGAGDGVKALRAIAVGPLLLALMCLIQGYFILRPALRNLDMERKFLFVKGLVAVMIIEQLVINICLSFDSLPKETGYTAEEQGHRLYAVVVIIELLVASVLMPFFFPPDQFRELWAAMPAHQRGGATSPARLKGPLWKILRLWKVMEPVSEEEQILTRSTLGALDLLTSDYDKEGGLGLV